MSFIRNRLRRLEDRGASEGCPECRLKPQVTHAYYPEGGDQPPEPERCPRCDRPLGVVIAVVYDDDEEGGGAYLGERLPRN